jgi:hypothetical protein
MKLNLLLIALVSLSFGLSACDKSSTHRKKPGRKAGQLTTSDKAQPDKKEPNQDKNPDGTPTTKNKPVTPAKPGTVNGKLVPNDGTTPEGETSTDRQSPTSVPDSKEPSTANGTEGRGTPIGRVGANQPQETNKAQTKSPATPNELLQFQDIMKDMHLIYQNAWFTITKDPSSHPRDFFEELTNKLQDTEKLIVLRDGQPHPTNINDSCFGYRTLALFDRSNRLRVIELYDCNQRQYTGVVYTLKLGTQWHIATTLSGMELFLKNQLGFLPTVQAGSDGDWERLVGNNVDTNQSSQIKPYCALTVTDSAQSARVVKASCRNWGQKYATTNRSESKTILFNTFDYDIKSTNVLVATAHFVDIDNTNQICKSGLMRRVAEQANKYIWVQDEGNDRCDEQPNDALTNLLNVGTRSQAPVAPVKGLNPRAQVAPAAKDQGQSPVYYDGDTGEQIEFTTEENTTQQTPPVPLPDSTQDGLQDAAPNDETSDSQNGIPEPPNDDGAVPLNPDDNPDVGAVDGSPAIEEVTPPQTTEDDIQANSNLPVEPLNPGQSQQQADFSSEAPQ